GTAAIVGASAGGRLIAGAPRGPLGDPVPAHYALVAPPAGADAGEAATYAVVESAQASGLTLLPPERRDPLRASSYGTGEQVRDALRRGAKRVVVGVGGTATNDGGAGAAQALGLRLL